MNNYIEIKFNAISENEALARNVISAFLLPLNPSIVELSDVKTSVSEAVTNCIVHGYPEKDGEVIMKAEISGSDLHIIISDSGIGISDIKSALEPFFTTKPDEDRSGMGFTIIKTFMDKVDVRSKINEGTVVDMIKHLNSIAK